ncbi:unnamed protein product, partial [Closterium sp. NIES-53]
SARATLRGWIRRRSNSTARSRQWTIRPSSPVWTTSTRPEARFWTSRNLAATSMHRFLGLECPRPLLGFPPAYSS